MFPTNVGYPGPTPTGAEAGVIATAPSYPIHSGAPHLVGPSEQMKNGNINASFDVFRHWGNLRCANGLGTSLKPDANRVL